MSLRRLVIVAVALGALVVSPVGMQAARAEAPQGGISSPAEGQVLTTVTPTIAGEYRQPRVASQAGKVDEVVVQLVGLQAQPIPGGGTFRQAGGGESLTFSWTTPRLTYNGPYEARAQAKGTDAVETNGQEVSAPSIRRFSLRVPPAVPSGFKAVVEGGTTVLISWTANREPDLIGYQVQRAAEGSSRYEEVGQTADTSYRDKAPASGEWRYRAVAVRAGANESELVASNPTNPSAVTVTAPPPSSSPPPSDGSDGGGGGTTTGGGSGAGSGSGSSTTTTSGSGGRAIATAGRVDLSGFAALLDRNRRPVRPVEPDPGFAEKLPFQTPTDELGTEDEEEELGADDPEGSAVGLGQTPISTLDDDGDRRRSVSFLAGGLLAFVMMMHVLWLKGQVDRVPDDLEHVETQPPTP